MVNQKEEAALQNSESDLKLPDSIVAYPQYFSSTRDFEAEIIEHMRANTIDYSGSIKLDGQIHRFSTDSKRNQKDEWYSANTWTFHGKSYSSCSYGSWSRQDEGWFHYESWDLSRESFSEEELEALKEMRKKSEQKQREAIQEKQREASQEALQIWEKASKMPLCPEHTAYLEKKQIQPYVARFGKHPRNDRESLIIPLLNSNQELVSLQFLYQDEEGNTQKRFLPGGQKRECFCLLGNLHEVQKIFIAEGFATGCSVHEASGVPVVIAFDCGNLPVVTAMIRAMRPNSRIIIAADNDDAGIAKAKEAAYKNSSEVLLPKFHEQKDLSFKPTDFNDLHVLQGIHEVKRQLTKRRLNPVGIFDFLAMDIKPKEFVLEPFCPVKGLVMIFGYRGGGKTFFALSIALAIAGGSSTLNFYAPKARRVLYMDGEMASISLHERISQFCLAKEKESLPPNNDFFRIVTPDLEEDIIPSLVTEEGQNAVLELMKDFEVLFVDNLSCLARISDENANSAEWGKTQEFLLKLRRLGKTVFIIHHAGKSGEMRGSSAKEDVLDESIKLKIPKNYDPSDGARFEVHYSKGRHVHGESAKPFEAKLHTLADGGLDWEIETLDDVVEQAVLRVYDEEKAAGETPSLRSLATIVANELGEEISHSKVRRVLKKAGRM